MIRRKLIPQTAEERQRIQRMIPLGCICCRALGLGTLGYQRGEVHHLVMPGKRYGHWFTVYLCVGHHQGEWTETQKGIISDRDRVNVTHQRRRFVAAYGTERSLWEMTQVLLDLPAEWPASKILPRRVA